jgi:hypothetical protein
VRGNTAHAAAGVPSTVLRGVTSHCSMQGAVMPGVHIYTGQHCLQLLHTPGTAPCCSSPGML